MQQEIETKLAKRNAKKKMVMTPKTLRSICLKYTSLSVIATAILIVMCGTSNALVCKGRFTNPVTDVCWKCLFPISIGPAKISSGKIRDTPNPKKPVCLCKGKLPPVGIPIGFWEPVRIAEVTKVPYCMISLGGVKLGSSPQKQGGVGHTRGNPHTKRSYYHAHWYIYPVMYLFELLTDFVCLEKNSFDIGYMTEFDPLWNDDAKGMILNPEAILFGNPVAQGLCAVDAVAATAHLPRDELFWCAGAQGSMYPFTGTINTHYSGMQATQLVVQKVMAKLHRQLLMWRTSGTTDKEICDKSIAPKIKKTQYRIQMTYPERTKTCSPLGASTLISEIGVEKPHMMGNFAYLIWRKRNCCATVPVKIMPSFEGGKFEEAKKWLDRAGTVESGVSKLKTAHTAQKIISAANGG